MTRTRNIEIMATEVAKHIAADAVVQGIYWDAATHKGCFIGCLAHSDDPSVIEDTYGIPVMLTRIAENIFEGLPADEAREFFAAFPDAVGCDGKDLSLVSWQFLAQILRELLPQQDRVQEVIDPVIAGLDLLASGQEWPREAARAAEVAAWTAWTAWAAAEVAAWTAMAAWAAAEAAAMAAMAAEAARLRQRDLLLDLIRQAPVLEGGNG